MEINEFMTMTGFLPSETARHHQAEVVGLLDAAIKQAKVDLCL
jgi:tRNA A37 threonylcarbamoyltransferase TsaD